MISKAISADAVVFQWPFLVTVLFHSHLLISLDENSSLSPIFNSNSIQSNSELFIKPLSCVRHTIRIQILRKHGLSTGIRDPLKGEFKEDSGRANGKEACKILREAEKAELRWWSGRELAPSCSFAGPGARLRMEAHVSYVLIHKSFKIYFQMVIYYMYYPLTLIKLFLNGKIE